MRLWNLVFTNHVRKWLCRKEEGYGTAPTFNVSILMGKRDEVTPWLLQPLSSLLF